MRFLLNVDQAVAAAGLAFCLAVGWEFGRWAMHKVLELLRL